EESYQRVLACKELYARVKLRVAPLPPGEGFKFQNALEPNSLPEPYLRAIEQSLRASAESGPLAGYQMVDLEVTLLEADYDEARAGEAAYALASREAFYQACRSGAPVLLEPMMEVEVVTPEEFLGQVIGDLNGRRGKVGGVASRATLKVVDAVVPLSRMFGYSTDLRSATQGRGTYSMRFSHYDRALSQEG
ncbi:MAG: elongation factor G, partial [Nitrospinota bacterium]